MTPEEFIFEYFRADQDTGSGSYEKMVSIAKDLDWSKIKPYILDLKYFYFLKTSYWLIISQEIKRRANWKCSCGCRESLQTHHCSYDHHGEEHLYMDDLQVLCNKCHQGGVHKENVSVKDAEKKRQRSNKKEEILSQLSFYPTRISEGDISGSSFTLTRKLLEELEHEHKVVIERSIYDGWRIHRQ
jgi:hypothetical protein